MPVANNFLDNFSNLDVDYAQDFDEKEESGEFRLWAEVTYRAIVDIHGKEANNFLFDERNPIIDAVCSEIGIDTDVFRDQMRLIEKHGQMVTQEKKRKRRKQYNGRKEWI